MVVGLVANLVTVTEMVGSLAVISKVVASVV